MIANMRTGTGIEYYRELQAATAPYGVECWNKECRFQECTNENRCLDWPIGFPPDHVDKPTDHSVFEICICGHGYNQHDGTDPMPCMFCACLAFNNRAQKMEFRPDHYLPFPVTESDLEPLPDPMTLEPNQSIYDPHPDWTRIAQESTTPIYDRLMTKLEEIRPVVRIIIIPLQKRLENARKMRAMAGASIRKSCKLCGWTSKTEVSHEKFLEINEYHILHEIGE